MNEKPSRRGNCGLACGRCGCRHFRTTHTEPLRDGRIRRRKFCRNCGKRLVTFESAIALKAPECYM
jgi:transcriptional regulator NrdR family protein